MFFCSSVDINIYCCKGSLCRIRSVLARQPQRRGVRPLWLFCCSPLDLSLGTLGMSLCQLGRRLVLWASSKVWAHEGRRSIYHCGASVRHSVRSVLDVADAEHVFATCRMLVLWSHEKDDLFLVAESMGSNCQARREFRIGSSREDCWGSAGPNINGFQMICKAVKCKRLERYPKRTWTKQFWIVVFLVMCMQSPGLIKAC